MILHLNQHGLLLSRTGLGRGMQSAFVMEIVELGREFLFKHFPLLEHILLSLDAGVTIQHCVVLSPEAVFSSLLLRLVQSHRLQR